MNDPSRAHLDELFTRFVDSDDHWGPLLFLRPTVSEPLGLARVLALSALLGIAFGLLGNIVLALSARALGRPMFALPVFPLVLSGSYFCLCQLTFVPAWNRRAFRLAKQRR